MGGIGYTKIQTRYRDNQETSLKTNKSIDYESESKFYELDTAIVVRVITDFEDPLVRKSKDTNLIGAILCTSINTSRHIDDDRLILAYPFDPNIKQYPVGETVL